MQKGRRLRGSGTRLGSSGIGFKNGLGVLEVTYPGFHRSERSAGSPSKTVGGQAPHTAFWALGSLAMKMWEVVLGFML